MDELKNSPFLKGLLIITLAATILFVALGVWQKTQYSQNKARYTKLAKELASMDSATGYPSQQTVENLKKRLVAYKTRFESLQGAVADSTFGQFENLSSSAFAAKLEAQRREIQALYAEKDISLPDEWNLGFERYSTTPAPSDATGLLSYQLEALAWLHQTIAGTETKKIINLFRTPVEDTLQTASPKGRQRSAPVQGVKTVPIELTLELSETALQELLNTLSKSSEYYFTIHTLKLANKPVERQKTKRKRKGVIKRRDFSQPDQDEQDAKLLDQVFGKETLNVFLELNLVYFNNQLELPTFN